ncbi:MAG: type II toxin-antitoxin system VapC family toxin [Acidobacteriaceae bacterium]|nr:type II toxin-antitoxin system VapC family toxin [Acidobacteriaceae bacterium]
MAILRKEPGYERYILAIAEADAVYISSVNLLESYLVLGNRLSEVDTLVDSSGILVWSFTSVTCSIARHAFLKYGKGRHKAALNICDCAAYATAKELNLPLLYQGNDFSLTDIEPVL